MSLVPEGGPLLRGPAQKDTHDRIVWNRVRRINPKVREVEGVDERIHWRVDELRALLSYSVASL